MEEKEMGQRVWAIFNSDKYCLISPLQIFSNLYFHRKYVNILIPTPLLTSCVFKL
jgi:hypothetical protein